MKNIKRFVLVASILAIFSLVLTACAMRSEQRMLYDQFVVTIVLIADKSAISAVSIKERLEEMNEVCEPNGFIIEDKEAGKAVPKKSKAAYVRKRFIIKKA